MDRHKWTWDFQKRMESAVANLTKCIGRLSDRDQSIVQARFGLGQWQQPCTLQSIADRLGVSRERVRQLEARALSRLGKMARETPGEGDFESD